jgi:hypothetical protein
MQKQGACARGKDKRQRRGRRDSRWQRAAKKGELGRMIQSPMWVWRLQSNGSRVLLGAHILQRLKGAESRASTTIAYTDREKEESGGNMVDQNNENSAS